MQPDEARIIGGGSPSVPGWKAFGRFLIEEAAWLLAAFAVTVLVAQVLLATRWSAAAPGVALVGLHALIGLHVIWNDAPSVPAWLRVRWRDFAWGLAGGAVLLGFNAAYGWCLDAAGIEVPDVPAFLRELLPVPVLFVWAGGIAPLVEELYFRGRLLEAFGARIGPVWAGVLSSAAFAAIHGIPAFIPAYLVFAAVLLALRKRTGALVAPITAHVLNNTLALLLPLP